MLEELSLTSRQAILLARQEARDLGHTHVDTEHLLLGLMGCPEGRAHAFLAELGLSVTAVRTQVREMVGAGETRSEGDVPFTAPADEAMQRSRTWAEELEGAEVRTDHLLLALLEPQNLTSHVLGEFGLDRTRLTEQLRARATDTPGPGSHDGGLRPDEAVLDRLMRIERKLGHLNERLARLERPAPDHP